jgi:hypothetical protein
MDKKMQAQIHTALDGNMPDTIYGIYTGTCLKGEDGQEPIESLFVRTDDDTDGALFAALEVISDCLVEIYQHAQVFWPVLAMSQHDPATKLDVLYEQLIKVHIPGEGLWAALLPKGKAILRNTPLDDGYAFGDIVQLASNGYDVARVLEKTYRQGAAQYEFDAADEEQGRKRYAEVYTHLEECGILCEGWVPGVIGCSIPVTMTAERAAQHAKECSHIKEWQDAANTED